MDNYVGKRIDGRYEIMEVTGVGGMAVVYKAYDTIDDRIVAVKILKEEYLENEEFRRKFKNESKAIAILNHPNIVKVYDVSFGVKIQYIVMEYVDGITLKDYIKKQGSISWKEAVHFEMQILQALQHAHDKGIIHRDIKPQNIILLQDGSIKVADFGIARFARSESRTLADGDAIGSVHYISPEQAKGDYTDERADLYSAGVVLYEMITGLVPFNADSAVSIAIMQLQNQAKTPTSINPSLPLGIEQITLHAMQKNPHERYQSAAEMLMDLKKLSENPAAVFPYRYSQGEAYIPKEDVVDREDEKNLVDMLEREEDREANELTGKKSDEYYREKYQPAKTKTKSAGDKKKLGILIAAAAVFVALIAAVCIFLFGGEKITVPKFIGMNYNEEIAKFVKEDTYNDGTVKCKIKLEYTDDADKYKDFETGQVVYQSPDAGIKMKSSKTVTLTILATGEGVEIPDIVGMSKDAAQIKLKEKGFKNFEFVDKPDKDMAEGNVISTSPEVGTKVDKETKITVYISAGDSFKMPSVVGMKRADAEKFLADYELKISYKEVDSTSEKDTVLEQSIADGEKTKMGASLTLSVSSGNAPTTTTETTTQPEEKNIVIKMTLPTENGEAIAGGDGTIKIYLGNALVEQTTVKCNGGTYSYTCVGTTGTKEFSAEVDGSEVISCIVNFDTGTYS